MKLSDVEVGGRYYAKVSGQTVIVRVTALRQVPLLGQHLSAKRRTVIDVVNERTDRKLTFRSAARLRRGVKPAPRQVKSDRERRLDAIDAEFEQELGNACARDGGA